MGFGDAVKRGFSNYANFSGRACRSEFWYWFLFVIILNIPFGIVYDFVFFLAVSEPTTFFDIFHILQSIINLALFLPSVSIFVRRAHDLDCSGWRIVPFGGVLWKKGTDGPNRFGTDRLAELGLRTDQHSDRRDAARSPAARL
jgi:uncharacterized membrane protein YhaH (DUF805 family)